VRKTGRDLIRQLQQEGIGIFLISHDIHDVFDLSDRISVMLQGKLVGTVKKEDVTTDEVLARAAGKADRAALATATGVSEAVLTQLACTADLMRNEEWFTESQRVGMRRAPPSKIFNHFPSTPGDVRASHVGFEGAKASVLSACSSSTVAIGYAADAIAAGRLDAALAGASDVLCRLTFSGFNALRLVDTEPCRPFCRTRKGMNIGERRRSGARGPKRQAPGRQDVREILGCGVRCEAYHPTAPGLRAGGRH
jgi:3-oxoacyl-(acyl-carrier-protein) synthase